MPDRELVQNGEGSAPSLAEKVSSLVDDAAGQVKQAVMSAVEALGDSFPRLEVAAEIVNNGDYESTRKIGAIALGFELHPVTAVPAVTVEIVRNYHSLPDDDHLLLTPQGLKWARSTRVESESPHIIKYAPRIQGLLGDNEALLWLRYGVKAAKAVEDLKQQHTQTVA